MTPLAGRGRETRRVPFARALGGALAAGLLGCASLGFRPAPPVWTAAQPACERFADLAVYAQGIEEAYHTRASQNRSWIYVGGGMVLAIAAASSGLALVGAAATTIAILALSGGAFGTGLVLIDNEALADVYTISATRVAAGLRDARAQLVYGDSEPDVESCAAAMTTLDAALTQAAADLERARTDAAAAATMRLEMQRDDL